MTAIGGPISLPRLDGEPSKVVQYAAAGVLAGLVVCGLYYGRPILVPLALAVLLAFALAPIAAYLRRHHVPHAISVGLTVLVALLSIVGLAAFIVTQLSQLATELPRYQSNLVQKVQAIRGSTASNSLVRGASGLVHNVNAALAAKPAQSGAHGDTRATTSGPRPIAVAVRQPDAAPFQVVEDAIDPFLEPAGVIAIVTVLVIFILLRKEDLRDRFISLAGAHDLQRTATAIDDGANRLSRFLLLQSAVNISFGIIIGSGLWWIGMPNPALWGLIAAIFRYVPYVGVPAAAALPLALGLAIDPGWQMVVLTAALYFGLEPIVGQAVEPWLYGRHMGISPLAVVIAAGVWTWLWGPIGLLLSTPLTMCVVVMGRHVKGLRFLEVLLGDQPALSDEESFYLRLLSGNADDVADQAEHCIKARGLVTYLDDVARPGLGLAQSDFDRSELEPAKCETIRSTVTDLVENLSLRRSHSAVPYDDGKSDEDAASIPSAELAPVVLCVAGRGEFDESASLLFVSLLRDRGIATLLEMRTPALASTKEHEKIRVVCLCLVDAAQVRGIRFRVRRARARYPSAIIFAGLWGGFDQADSKDTATYLECDGLARTFKDAVEQIERVLAPPAEELRTKGAPPRPESSLADH